MSFSTDSLEQLLQPRDVDVGPSAKEVMSSSRDSLEQMRQLRKLNIRPLAKEGMSFSRLKQLLQPK